MATNVLPAPLKPAQLKSDKHPDWCPGCGDFGITNAIQQAVAGLQLPPWNVHFFTGVGCSGKTSHYVQCYGVHTLHGRSLAFASGAKLSNPELTVIVAGGDGDGYGIGAGHFVHAGRRNLDMTYIVFDNEVYGLTKGQASPTLPFNDQPKSLAAPHITQPINPFALALTVGYTFIARTYAYDAKHMKATLEKAISHKGMALVDVVQPCPTYNDLRTKEFFAEEVSFEGAQVPRIYYMEDEGYNGVVNNSSDFDEVTAKRKAAFEKIYETDPRTGLGVYYQIELPTYHDLLKQNVPMLNEYTPVGIPYYNADMTPTTDLAAAYAPVIV
ncbi:MAG: thiamine pyrophosphate-dependent enzyme [Vampirovibrionales bacterium]